MISFLKIFANLKSLLALAVVGLGVWVQALRLGKAERQRDREKHKVDQLKRTTDAQNRAREEGNETIEAAKDYVVLDDPNDRKSIK